MTENFETLWIEECVVCGTEIEITAQSLELETVCPECGARYWVRFDFIAEGSDDALL